jgi:PKD repeat protein
LNQIHFMRLAFLFLLLVTTSVSVHAQKTDWKSFIPQLQDNCKLQESDFDNVIVTSHHKSPKSGMEVIWLRQTLNGLEILGADVQLVLDKNQKLTQQQCHFLRNLPSRLPINQKLLTLEMAAEKALQSKGIDSEIELNELKSSRVNRWTASNKGVKGKINIEHAYWPDKDGKLHDSYTFRFTPQNSDSQWQIRIDAANGNILDSRNLTLSCHFGTPHLPAGPLPKHFTHVESNQQILNDGSHYRVFPFPFESPLNGPRLLLSNPADDQASPFGWHDLDGLDGADDTRSVGNNVNAYDDQNNDDAPDDYVYGGASLNFDFPYTPTPNNTPLNNREAAITNLFYSNNRVHDVLWHYGFDEESGNFQYFNYSTNGVGNDAVNAEAFDGSGSNNANFGTPPDGEAPRMQMYLWSNNLGSYLTINSPSSIAGIYTSAVSAFGPQLTPVPITGQVIEMNDGSSNPTLGCGNSIDDLTGKIVLVDRGTCPFVDKVFNAQLAGAIGVIVVNNQAGSAFSMGGINPDITIPALMVSQADGEIIRAALSGNVNATIDISSMGNSFDSSFDNGVVSHEYGHGVSNRLTGGPFNTDCLFNEEQMGEGWSDFIALIMTSSVGNYPDEARAIGNYVQGLAIDGGGIRPFPYSRNMSVNPVTYDDIQQLSIPHGLGSVWCSMLWDLYWDMIDVYGYDADIINGNGGNNKTIQLVMDGMRLQVCSPGFIDGRDAILQADELNFAGANRCLIWKTFARRGLGYSANQGSSESAFDGTSAFDKPPFCSQTDFANFTSSSQTVCAGSTISFVDITEPISNSVVWSFEGGLPASSIASNVDVTFNTPGSYSAILTSTTSLGTDTITQTITVVESPSLSANVGLASATADNGFIFITMSGGLPPFTTYWADIPGLNDLTVNLLASGSYEVTITDAAGCSIDTVFTVQRAAGIDEFSQSTFQAFPNPVKENITLRFNANQKPENIELLDLSGRKILQFQMEQSSKNEFVLSCPDLASGTYIIQVQFRNSTIAYKRIVKQ